MTDPDDRPRAYRTSRYDRAPRGRSADERDDYDDDPRRYRPDPRQQVQGPGLAMSVVGWIGVALAAFGFLIVAVVGASDPTLPKQEYKLRFIFGGIFALIAIAMFAVIAVGGGCMRRCRTYGFAMTAAVLLILTFIPLGLFAVFTMPFGVWAVVVLSNAEVKREFSRAPRTTRPVDGGWEGRR